MDATSYEITGLQVDLAGRTVLGPLDLRIDKGSFMGIVGPNGSGKTTLLRVLSGALRPSAGQVLLEGRPLEHYRPAQTARRVGMVPQSFTLDFNFTVEETVALGRYARDLRSARSTEGDAGTPDPGSDPVAHALTATGLDTLADRLITRLSGGERQRTLIAQTLAQDTPILLLDEPLNNLDLNHQLEVMQLLRELHSAGRTIVVVLHDLNMAAQYCDELVLLDRGRIIARGTPEQVLDPPLLLEVFKARVAVHRQGRRPYVTPIWSEPLAAPPGSHRTKVHVIAGGGAATALVEELVLAGYAPSVGVVSVFDTDYATAQSYGLEVVSTPPFEPLTPEALKELDSLVDQADAVIVAPVFFGEGNLAPLRTALRAAKAGAKVILVSQPPLADRDLCGGQAHALVGDLLAAGALEAPGPAQAVELVRG